LLDQISSTVLFYGISVLSLTHVKFNVLNIVKFLNFTSYVLIIAICSPIIIFLPFWKMYALTPFKWLKTLSEYTYYLNNLLTIKPPSFILFWTLFKVFSRQHSYSAHYYENGDRKRKFLRKTSFRQNRFIYLIETQKLITVNTWNFHQMFILTLSSIHS